MKQQKIHKWPAVPRRGFLKTILGLLGGIVVPVLAKPDKSNSHASLREADFYRPKEYFGEKKKQ